MIGARRIAAPGLLALALASLLAPASTDARPVRPASRALVARGTTAPSPVDRRLVPTEPARDPNADCALPELSSAEEDSSDGDSLDLAFLVDPFPIPGRGPIRIGVRPILGGEVIPPVRRSIVLRC